MLRKSSGSEEGEASAAACRGLLERSKAGHCLRRSRQLLISCCKRLRLGLRSFCLKSELAGLSYLVAPNYHWSERVFWLFCLILNFVLAIYCVLGFYSYYAENVFQSVIEDQPTFEAIEFPAIAVCETGEVIQAAKIKKLTNALSLPHTTATKDFENVLLALVNPHYHKRNNGIVQKFINFTSNTANFEYFNSFKYKSLTRNLTSTCDELFEKCLWHDFAFNCCEYFSLINSMSQSCYALNSLQADGNKHLNMLLYKNKSNAQVVLVLKSEAQAFVLSKEEIPQFAISLAQSKVIKANRYVHFTFQIRESYNDPRIYKLSRTITGCMSPLKTTKGFNQTYRIASYTTCLADCLRHLQQIKCGCISHTLNEGFGKYQAQFCNLSGYACLERAHLYSARKMENFRNTSCELCLPACNENFIKVSAQGVQNTNSKYGKVSISLAAFPKKRMRRLMMRTHLDVFIMLGGVFSLFMGCSLVHLIELLYCVVSAFFRPNLLK